MERFSALNEIKTWFSEQESTPENEQLRSNLRELAEALSPFNPISPEESAVIVGPLLLRADMVLKTDRFPVLREMVTRLLPALHELIERSPAGHQESVSEGAPPASSDSRTADEIEEDEAVARAIKLSLEEAEDDNPGDEPNASASTTESTEEHDPMPVEEHSTAVELPDEDRTIQLMLAASKDIGAYATQLQEDFPDDLVKSHEATRKLAIIAFDVTDLITYDRSSGQDMSVWPERYAKIKNSIESDIAKVPVEVLKRLPKFLELIRSYPPLATTAL